jgi:hypothetical protein
MATTFERAAAVKPSPSLAHRITALVRDAGGLARDHLELAVLDAHRAAVGLTKILTAAVGRVDTRRHRVARVRRERHRVGDGQRRELAVALVIAGVANLVVAGGLVF